MNNENQQIQPDYGFILNQPSGQAPQKKPHDKKLLIVAILVVVSVAALLALVLLPSGGTNKGAKPDADPKNQNSPATGNNADANAGLSDAERQVQSVTTAYYAAAQANKPEDVDKLLSNVARQTRTKDILVAQVERFAAQYATYKDCSLEGKPEKIDDDSYRQMYKCENATSTVRFSTYVVIEDKIYKVDTYEASTTSKQ